VVWKFPFKTLFGILGFLLPFLLYTPPILVF
jgi:hypothetical protein